MERVLPISRKHHIVNAHLLSFLGKVDVLKPTCTSFKVNQTFVVCWVDALRPRSTAEVISGRSVILSTLFLGKPPRGR